MSVGQDTGDKPDVGSNNVIVVSGHWACHLTPMICLLKSTSGHFKCTSNFVIEAFMLVHYTL